MTAPQAPRRPDESMTLLTSMFERPLDPGYEAMAERRERAGLPRSTGARTPLLIVTVIVVGILLGIATVALRDRSTYASRAKAELIQQIQDQQKVADERSTQIRQLQEAVAAAEASPLDSGSAARSRDEINRLRVATGGQAVKGPGFVVTLDDAPSSDPAAQGEAGSSTGSDQRVIARDLQIVTNSLWASGAEAISINGHRLTSRSAIRFAGEAILVNFRPLDRPYVITAIGDPQTLPTSFAGGLGGAYLKSLHDNYGIVTNMSQVDEVVLPSAVTGTLRVAKAIDQTPPPTSSTEGKSTP